MTWDLFSYPRGPGFRESTTSRDAAAAIEPRVWSLRDKVLHAIEAEGPPGLTPDECAGRMGLTVLAVRPRFTELKLLGKIEKTGERRANASGLKAAAWRARRS